MPKSTLRKSPAHICRLSGSSIIALLLAMEPVLAQEQVAGSELQQEEAAIIVTGARGVARDLSSLPISISILDTKQIQAQVSVQPNLSRALSLTVPGFNLIGDNIDAGGSIGTQLRGRDTLTVVNGIPINTLFFGAGVDLANFDPEAIGRIEVIRAASAAYGFGANGGIIAVSTKRPMEDGLSATSKVSTEIMTEGSGDNISYLLYQDIAGQSETGAFRLGVSYRNNGTAYSGKGSIIPSDFSYYNKSAVNIDLYGVLNIDDNQKIEVTGNYFNQRWDSTQYAELGDCVPALSSPTGKPQACSVEMRSRNDTLFGPSIGDGLIATPKQRFLLGGITYTHSDLLGSIVNLQLFHTNLNWVFTGFSYEEDGFRDANGNLINNGLFGAQLITKENRLGARANADTPIGNNGARLLWGYDYLRYQNTNDTANGTIPDDLDPAIFSAGKIKQTSHAIFGQGELPIGNLTVSAGIRHEWIKAKLDSYRRDFPFNDLFIGGNISYSATTINGGVVWKAAQGLDIYAGLSQGYDVTDLARGTFSVDNAAFLDPAPAKATIYELGARYRQGAFSTSLAAFYSDSKNGNRFEATFNDNGDFVNSRVIREPKRIWGLEATVDARLSPSLNVGGTAAWQEGDTDDPDGRSVPLRNNQIAPLKLTGYVSYQALQWLNLRSQAVYTGKRTFEDAVVNEGGRGPVRPIFLLDILASAQFGRHQVDLGVANLLNRFYFSPAVQSNNFEGCCVNPALGRTIQLSYKANF